MSLQDLQQKYGSVKTTTPTLTGLNALKAKYTPVVSSKKLDLGTVEGLTQKAQESGLGKQAAKITEVSPKLSALQRLSTGLDILNPAEAILTGTEKGVGAGIAKYGTGIVKGLGSAITGTDYVGEKRHFADVVEKLGIENKIAKAGIGFIGDVLLDPSTYFGGAIARGLTTTAKAGTNIALKGIGKVAPATEAGLRMAGTGLQDAIGKAFEYGYKTTKGAKEDILTFMSKAQRARLGIAASNLDRLGTGTLSQAQREELALKMVAGKRAEFTAREAGKTIQEAGKIGKETALTGTSKEVAPIIEKQMARTQKFGVGTTENPYETYFPFLKKDKVEKFLNESKGLRVGSEGYKKEFKNLLTNENIELDPAKAFFTRESQVVSDKMTRNFLQGFVNKYGKPLTAFKNSDEAAKEGYKLIKEKGIFGKEVGYAPEFDAKLLRDSLDPGYQTISMLAKATGFDAVTSLFKRSVTGLFAPFHVRNYMSGLIQNFEVLGIDALNPKNVSIGQKIAYNMATNKKMPTGLIEIGGKKMKFDQVMKPFVDRFSGDTFYNADFDLALKSGSELKSVASTFSKERLKETVKTVGLGEETIPFKVARGIGQFIEHQQKATAYVTALNQGKSIPDALKLAENAGFDYRALTGFESQIMRRIIPFYSFTRKNIALQLQTLGENPQRINQVLNFFPGAFGTEKISEEEKKALPAFIKESIGAKIGDSPEGLKQYISSFGTPIEAFVQLFGSNPILRTISQTNPILKAPIEIGIGKDSFRQRDLQDVYDAREYKMAPQIIKDMLDITEVKRDILKKNAQGKLVKVGERTQYVADPVKLLIARSLFTSRGVSYLDQVFGNDLKGFVKVIKTTTGFKPQQIDLELQKAVTEKKTKRELEDLLIKRTSDVKQFNKLYTPKK